MTTDSVPEKFQGFGVDKAENWDKPKLVSYEHKKINPYDVVIKNECCGVCYSDIHTIQGNWGKLNRDDLVVGHEIVGKVVAVGDKVTEFKVGQRVGTGANASACRKCNRCKNDNEQYCPEAAPTYNGPDVRSDGYITQGGYASHSIADEQFVFAIPDELESKFVASLLCAGLTVWSPIVRNCGYDATGKTIAIIGLGGLGHLAVQESHAIGAKVVVFSTTASKREEALKLGADEFVATKEDKDWYKTYFDTFDFILSCASGIEGLDLEHYISTLKVNKKFVSVGLPPSDEKFSVSPNSFVAHAASFGSSLLGNKKEVYKMLDLAVKKNVRPWIEEVPISEKSVPETLKRFVKGDVRYRFVLTDFDKFFGDQKD
ncbi:unnamed protein product [Candida verbasci]|uniref:Uncharacterized protein n=1 Tax=Candida verbasci TaxID=1227364 RepID=A0A9W4TYI7_9ASCO|nr:unnamed protein product [Candida verbasci]